MADTEPKVGTGGGVVQKRSTTANGKGVGVTHNASHQMPVSEFREANYTFDCVDNNKRANNEPSSIADCSTSAATISFTHSNIDSSGQATFNRSGRYLNKNFDIHLAEIDIETFKKEDIEKLNSYNNLMDNSNDTLRIEDSLSLNNVLSDHLQAPSDNCEVISVDSLDLSLEDEEEEEINSKLIEQCSKKDKTRYKIAMIDSSTHSMMQNSYSSQTSDCDFNSNLNCNRAFAKAPRDQSDRISELLKLSLDRNCFNNSVNGGEGSIQSPGSLMKLFIQNKTMENSSGSNGNYFGGQFSKCDTNYNLINNRAQGGVIAELDEANVVSTSSPNSTLNTVDSAELPLHVLDLSKKMRQMNLSKQLYSASMSSNTSYTSTTTSSSSTFDKHKHKLRSRLNSNGNSNNPFLPLNNGKEAKSVCTQFPEKFQDKQIQACFDGGSKESAAPVLVYYPNYSLPDLSFLQDVFRQGQRGTQPIYLSPVKHDPICKEEPSTEPISGPSKGSEVNPRPLPNDYNTEGPKSRPKSYADYETLLYQDFSHIQDWDSLNLLLPDDFKEFIERNNLAYNKERKTSGAEGYQQNFPIKATIPTPPSGRIPGVRLRSHSHRVSTPDKRYSLQEPCAASNGGVNHVDIGQIDYANYYPRYPHEIVGLEEMSGGFMTRSQTMPNCGLQYAFHQGMPLPPPPPSHGSGFYCGMPQPPLPSGYHGCCCRSHHSHHQYCHSSCHSPSMHSSSNTTSSPQKPLNNFNWDLFSSSTSFKRLMSLLNKLDEFSSTSNEENTLMENTTTSNGTLVDRKNQKTAEVATKSAKVNERGQTNKAIEKQQITRTYSHRNSRLVSQNSRESKNIQAQPQQPKPTPPPLPARMNYRRTNVHSKATSPTDVPPPTKNNNSHRPTSVPEKTRIILKRPAPPNKTPSANVNSANTSTSGIPLPRRTSRIPLPRFASAGGNAGGKIKEYRGGNTRF